MQPQQNLKSAFSLVKEEKQIDDYFSNLSDYVQSVLHSGNKLKVVQHFGLVELPVFLKLIVNLIITLLTSTLLTDLDSSSHPNVKQIIYNLLKNPLSLKIKVPTFTTIALIIENKLYVFQNQKYYDQISYSMFFNSSHLPITLSILSNGYQYIRMDRFNQFYNSLITDNNKDSISQYFFSLYGGYGLAISRNNFEKYLTQIIIKVGTFFTTKQSMITRNINYAKNLKSGKKILDDSVLVLSNFKNIEYISIQIKLIGQDIFVNEQFLSRNIFIQKLKSSRTVKVNQKSLPLAQYLRVYFQLLQLQFTMIQNSNFQTEVNKREHLDTSSNYYLESMQKLLKKCPYNGHESCDCKKCNCVRRNRQSAKLSQQKKRNAVQQVGQLQERIIQLEKRNKCLEEYNSFLINLFDSIRNKSQIKQAIAEYVQPISKILDNCKE